ncbi:MAG TPA: hypothetical protein VLJ76_05870 [Gaiellaceae bacterium]|nr:hypothetical protein [Gaiellaceae bacterium]
MKVGLACFALAAAIGTPGLVVGAMSSAHDLSAVTTLHYQTAIIAPEHQPPIAPELRPAVNAVKSAFAARGTKVLFFPLGSHQAEGVSLSPGTGCQVEIQITTTRGSFPERAKCPFTTIHRSKLEIDYSPPSIGPTIESALATLR